MRHKRNNAKQRLARDLVRQLRDDGNIDDPHEVIAEQRLDPAGGNGTTASTSQKPTAGGGQEEEQFVVGATLRNLRKQRLIGGLSHPFYIFTLIIHNIFL